MSDTDEAAEAAQREYTAGEQLANLEVELAYKARECADLMDQIQALKAEVSSAKSSRERRTNVLLAFIRHHLGFEKHHDASTLIDRQRKEEKDAETLAKARELRGALEDTKRKMPRPSSRRA